METNKNKCIRFAAELDDCIWRKHRRKGDIADKVGIRRVTLSHYTNGVRIPSVETFMRICDELDLADDEIMQCLDAFRE